MRIPAEHREERAAYLGSLLPPHVLARDDRAGGLLRELLGAVAGELAVIENDVQGLYDSWFVETAPEWVLPYLADLVGLVGLPGDLGPDAGVSRRAVVANTVSYRQRKGTLAVLEQVVRDVTGWPAKAVEYHPLLGTTTHVNHVRPDRPAWATVRGAKSAELESPRVAAGALTGFSHAGEVRHIDPGPRGGRGRYGIVNVGVFVFPVQVHGAAGVPARRTAHGWATHPLGLDQPLFARPAVEEAVEHLATESDLPVPLRPRRLLAALAAARAAIPGPPLSGPPLSGPPLSGPALSGPALSGPPLPLSVRIDGAAPLSPDRVLVCGLENLSDGGGPPTGWQVMVDPVRGLLHPFRDGVAADPASLHVDHDYGAVADIGAGTYDRSLAHAGAVAGDPHDQDADADRDRIAAQVPVRAGGAAPGHQTSIADGLTTIGDGWPATGATEAGPGGTQVLSVADSETYPGDLTITVPERRRLVLVAADWRGRDLLTGDVQAPVPGIYSPDGVRPRIVGDVLVTGALGSAVVLDGLVIEGDVLVRPGDLRALTLSQCTLAGTLRVLGTDVAGNRELTVAVRRSLLGGVELGETAPALTIADSVVDARFADLDGTGTPGPAVTAPGGQVEIDGSTLFGAVSCRLLTVDSSICDGPVTVGDRQRGCARYSYLGPGSSTPRRYRCVPPMDAAAPADRPSYLAADPGSPYYPSLSAATPVSIRRGGASGAEMGVHHHLRRPLREDAARHLVQPYLPAGMALGLFGADHAR